VIDENVSESNRNNDKLCLQHSKMPQFRLCCRLQLVNYFIIHGLNIRPPPKKKKVDIEY
jgi:hypothetical protein